MTTITVTLPSVLHYRNERLGIAHTLDLDAFRATHGADALNTMVYAIAANGFQQKLGDGTAKGGDASDEQKIENVARIFTNLQNNVWAERGGARVDPVLREMRGLAVTMKLMVAKVAAKATEAEIEAAAGAKYKALRSRAEAIVALSSAPLELDEPIVA